MAEKTGKNNSKTDNKTDKTEILYKRASPEKPSRKRPATDAPQGETKKNSVKEQADNGSPTAAEKKLSEKSGSRKAAEFLILIGKEEAARVLKHLTEEEVSGITREIANIPVIKDKEAGKILEEFGYLIKTKDLVARGGLEKAQEMLVTAFGKEKGLAVFERIKKRTLPHPFSFLKDYDPEQVLLLLKDESSRVISVVLAHLEHNLAARVLSSLPAATQKEVTKRIATIQKISPEVIQTIEASLRERVRQQGRVVTQEINGKAALLEIMKHLDFGQEKQLLAELEKQDTALADDIKKNLFTCEVLLRIREKDLQKILQNYNEKELALILKGKNAAIKQRILNNVSSRRRELIQFEYNTWGEVLRSEVDKATADFLHYLRTEVEQGKIVILDKNEDYID